MPLGSLVNGLLGVVVLQGLLGCASRGVATHSFQDEFKCNEEIQVYQLGNDTVRVEGCGLSETYHCRTVAGDRVLVTSLPPAGSQASAIWEYNFITKHFEPNFKRAPSSELTSTTFVPTAETQCEREQFNKVERPVPPPPRRGPPPKVASEVRVETQADGDVVVELELGLDGQSLLGIAGYPKRSTRPIQLKLLRSEVDHSADTCDLQWFAQGQRLDVPAPRVVRRNQFLERQQLVSEAVVEALGSAAKITLHSCRHRWSLRPDQVEKVHQFASRFHEQLAPQAAEASPPLASDAAEPTNAQPAALP